MRTIKTYSKRAPFYNAFTRHLDVLSLFRGNFHVAGYASIEFVLRFAHSS
jgi:hypothetical protein